MKTISGSLIGTGLRCAVAASRRFELISERLLEDAVGALTRHGVRHSDIEVYRTPGIWELPLAVHELALSGRYDAIVAVGAVIGGDRGAEKIYDEVVGGLSRISLEQRVPVGLGLLCCASLEGAAASSGGGSGCRGSEAAADAVETASLLTRTRAQAKGENDE
ncbi:MAG: 6,7-dimethyl-8-ribityllumazine synthase [Synergistaceae bacterium]|jgi:6,7-dimethyl-8-ribityllumazine synthase|nr:6,7-dimethyl-8-ribityllumazine synthase [Synergistaceae bacterium]